MFVVWGYVVCSLFCYALVSVFSCFAVISTRKRERVALLELFVLLMVFCNSSSQCNELV